MSATKAPGVPAVFGKSFEGPNAINRPQPPQQAPRPGDQPTAAVAQQVVATAGAQQAAGASPPAAHAVQVGVKNPIANAFASIVNRSAGFVLGYHSTRTDKESISTYLIQPEAPDDVKERIIQFMLSERLLLLTPSKDEASLKTIMGEKSYVVIHEWSQLINGENISRATMCFATSPNLKEGTTISPRDFFSWDEIINPVKCTEGHLLEYDNACVWYKQVQNICPVGNAHSLIPIGQRYVIKVDTSIQSQLKARRKAAEKVAKRVLQIVQNDTLTLPLTLRTGCCVGGLALLGGIVGGPVGSLVGAGAGIIVTTTTKTRSFLRWFCNRVLDLLWRKEPLWEQAISREYENALKQTEDGEPLTELSIERNYHDHCSVIDHSPHFSPAVKKKLQQLLNESKDLALKSVTIK